MNPRVVGMAKNIPAWSLWASSVEIPSAAAMDWRPWPYMAARRRTLATLRVTPAASTMGAYRSPPASNGSRNPQSLAQLAMTTGSI